MIENTSFARPTIATRATSASTPRSREAETPTVPAENILQLLPDAVVLTNQQLERHWRAVAKKALPHLAYRPLKLVRHVAGTTFYHMGPLPPIPRAVQRLKIRKADGLEGTRLWVRDVEGLLGLLKIGVVEVHPWCATVTDIEHPDLMAFDLDPGEGIEWDFVVETAHRLRAILRSEGFECWPKLTGGTGVHLMAPIEPTLSHREVHAFAKSIAEQLAVTDPHRYTTLPGPARRVGRVFVDYLRNGRGCTAIGCYSPRARQGLPVAFPITWRQIDAGLRPDAYRIDGKLRAPS